jgi:hypothetical protein
LQASLMPRAAVRSKLDETAIRGDEDGTPGRLRPPPPALNRAAADGTEITVAGIARAASVDRTFLYRHRDLLGQIHALEARTAPAAAPPARQSPAPHCKPTCSPPISAASG